MVGGGEGCTVKPRLSVEKWAKETEAEKFGMAIGQGDKWNISAKTVLTYNISKNLC